MKNMNSKFQVPSSEKKIETVNQESPLSQDFAGQAETKKNPTSFRSAQLRGARKINLNLLFFVCMGILIIGEIIGSVFLLSKISQKADEISKIRTQNLSFSMNSQDEMLLIQELDETEEKRQKLDNIFPDEEGFLKFIEIIDEIKKSGLQVKRFTVDSDVPTKIGKSQSLLPITLILVGKEEEIDKALEKIIESKFLIRVIGFAEEFTNKEENQMIMTISFHLYVSDEFNKINP